MRKILSYEPTRDDHLWQTKADSSQSLPVQQFQPGHVSFTGFNHVFGTETLGSHQLGFGIYLNETFDIEHYDLELERISNNKYIIADTLAEVIYDYAHDEIRTCDNGGFAIHVCPYGCHKVRLETNESNNDFGKKMDSE